MWCLAVAEASAVAPPRRAGQTSNVAAKPVTQTRTSSIDKVKSSSVLAAAARHTMPMTNLVPQRKPSVVKVNMGGGAAAATRTVKPMTLRKPSVVKVKMGVGAAHAVVKSMANLAKTLREPSVVKAVKISVGAAGATRTVVKPMANLPKTLRKPSVVKANTGVGKTTSTTDMLPLADRETTSRSSFGAAAPGDFVLKQLVATRPLSVGSHCSGLATECIALGMLGIQDYIHTFASDICRNSERFIKNNFPPKFWISDCCKDASRHAHYVDIYVAGFPCQSFSRAGRNLGLADLRGQVVWEVLQFVVTRKPVIFVFENVQNLMVQHKEVLEVIKTTINNIRDARGLPLYDFRIELVNSQHYGVPQNRPRVYMIGRLRRHINKHVMQLNSLAKPPSLVKFLGLSRTGGTSSLPIDVNATARRNLELALDEMRKAGLDPRRTDMVVDIASGQGLNMMHDLCPTITKSRGQGTSYWVWSIGRRLSTFELARLQGIEPKAYNWSGICSSGIGALVGNGMTATVLAHMLGEALVTTGLAKAV